MRLHAGLGMGLIFLAGCAGMNLSEKDNGGRVGVAVGSTFTLSLPSTPSSQAEPKIPGSVVQLLSRKRQDGREVFEFQAMAKGETEIRFADFSFQVVVGSGSGSNPAKTIDR